MISIAVGLTADITMTPGSGSNKAISWKSFSPWYEQRRWALIIGLMICVAVEALLPLCRNSMEESWGEWLYGAMVFGWTGGLRRFLIWVLGPVLLLMLVGQVKEWNRIVVCVLSIGWALLLALPMTFYAVEWLRSSEEPFRLKNITALDWPAQSHCHLAVHSIGGADKRHLWAFEGSRMDLQKHLDSLTWNPVTLPLSEPLPLPVSRAKQVLEGEEPWAVAEVYAAPNVAYKASRRNADGRFSGTSWLLVDKDHTRWCIGWVGKPAGRK